MCKSTAGALCLAVSFAGCLLVVGSLLTTDADATDDD